jgi:hypothetical protein
METTGRNASAAAWPSRPSPRALGGADLDVEVPILAGRPSICPKGYALRPSYRRWSVPASNLSHPWIEAEGLSLTAIAELESKQAAQESFVLGRDLRGT